MPLPILLYRNYTWTLCSGLVLEPDHGIQLAGPNIQPTVGDWHTTYYPIPGPLTLYDHVTRFPQDDPAHQVASVRNNFGWRPRKPWLRQINQICREAVEMSRGLG